MPATYKIHPAIGIARLGNCPDEFCISPEEPAALPIACDAQGNPRYTPDGRSEKRIGVHDFKDAEGRIKRQAARFRVYVYDDDSPEGRELKLGDPIEGGGNEGVLIDIQWRVYLANKKAVWYEFDQLEGEHGYKPGHPRRNADVTDPEARQRLIIDPGPQVVNCTDRRSASFSRDGNGLYAPIFPPELRPHSIDTLGQLKTDDVGRLLVLGGHGHSGSYKFNEFGQPRIETYANNDGWFDDTSDGPVMARLVMYSANVAQVRFIDVEYPAWVIVGYPAYVPQILDLVTIEDVLTDVAIRHFADRTDLYGAPGTFDHPQQIDPTNAKALIHWKAGALEWNRDYKPWFYRDIWPILFRADEMTYLSNVLAQSNYPHNQTERGNFDPAKLGVPPVVNKRALAERRKACMAKNHVGDLLLESLDPVLTMLDSDADSFLHRTLREFDHSSRDLMVIPESGEEEKAYQDWLESLRQDYPEILGGLLFDRFKDQIREAAGQFAETIYEANHTAMLAEMEVEQVEEAFGRYIAHWQGAFAEASPDYAEEKSRLENVVHEITAQLSEEATENWHVRVGKIAPLLEHRGHYFKQELESLQQTVAEFIQQYVFERLANYTLRNLDQYRTGKLLEECEEQCIEKCAYDPFRTYRQYLFELVRQPGEENHFRLGGQPNKRTFNLPLMPLLAGDNPISNTLPSKFLRLTDHQFFLLRQWARGRFYNEETEGWATPDACNPYAGWVNKTGRDLDRGVLFNLLGGAFCPGGEVGWIIRNPAIYHRPFRLKADPDFYAFRQTAAQANQQRGALPDLDYISYVETALSQESDFDRGLQPGDLTKYMSLPWQSDFNECSTQPINVTYEAWNNLYPESEGDSLLAREEQVWETMWWPAHRPLQTFEVIGYKDGAPEYQMLNWARGIPGTNAGDLKMVTAWPTLRFVVRNPYLSESDLDKPSPDNKYISVTGNHEGAGQT